MDKYIQTIKELGWFLFFSSELPYKSLLQKNTIELFTLVLTNINPILEADPNLAIYNMQGTILTDYETPIIRNSDKSDIQLGSTIRMLNACNNIDVGIYDPTFKSIWSRYH